jgi:hypothetical protein
MFEQAYFPFNSCFHVKQFPSIRGHFAVLYFSAGTHTGKQLMCTGTLVKNKNFPSDGSLCFDLECTSDRDRITKYIFRRRKKRAANLYYFSLYVTMKKEFLR